VRLDEVVSGGGRPVDPLADSPVGLTLVEGKTILGVPRARLVEARPPPTVRRGDNAGIAAARAR
jgi:hypothetical protein